MRRGKIFLVELRNTGEGSFIDVTETSVSVLNRTLETGRPGQVVAFADIDNDGDLDVYTGHKVAVTVFRRLRFY